MSGRTTGPVLRIRQRCVYEGPQRFDGWAVEPRRPGRRRRPLGAAQPPKPARDNERKWKRARSANQVYSLIVA